MMDRLPAAPQALRARRSPTGTTAVGNPCPGSAPGRALRTAALLLALLTPALLPAQVQDGVIGRGEYPFRAEFKGGDFILHWNVAGDRAAFAMEAETPGWVSIGFEPTAVMENADMIVGWVDGQGKVFVLDCFSTGMFGPHPPDTDLGGTEDIISYGGSETGGRTVIEFLRPLTSRDPYDRNLPPSGGVDVIWAFGGTDNFENIHAAAGSGSINLASGDSRTRRGGPFLPLHASAMALALLLMAVAAGVARFLRKKTWWLRTHRPLGIAAGVLAAGGLASALVFVGSAGGPHLRVLHAWVGLGALAAAFSAPFLGHGFLKSRKNKPLLRTLHHRAGWAAASLMALAAVLGLRLVGLL